MFSEANSLKSRSLSGKFTKVVSLLVRILDSENRFRSGIVVGQGQMTQQGQSQAKESKLWMSISLPLGPDNWASVRSPRLLASRPLPTTELKDTEHQDLWEPLDGEFLYTPLSGSAATACLKR